MTLQDLYRQFNTLMNKRKGTHPLTNNLDRVPNQRVLDSWCEDMAMYLPDSDQLWLAVNEDPHISRQLCYTAMCIRIAKQQGMPAAVLWKLQQAGNDG